MGANELPQELYLVAADLLSAVAPRLPHDRSMTERKSERKYVVAVLFNLPCAIPGRPQFPGCPPPTVAVPGELPAAGQTRFRSATTRTSPSKAASELAKIPDRHRPRRGSTCRAGCE